MKNKIRRIDANKKILEILATLIEKHPELRFHQILLNYSVTLQDIDMFFEESLVTLARLQQAVENFEE